MFVNTQNSIYEIDQTKKLVRKLSGVAVPTARTGNVGEWKSYEDLVLAPGYPMSIIWRYDIVNSQSIARSTVTSIVLSIKESHALADQYS